MDNIIHYLETFDIYYKEYLIPKLMKPSDSNNVKIDSENEDLSNAFEGFFRTDDFIINYSLKSIKITDLLQIIHTRACQIIYLETNMCANHKEKHCDHKILIKHDIYDPNGNQNSIKIIFSLIENNIDISYIMFSFNESI